jgi:hypothetical protein
LKSLSTNLRGMLLPSLILAICSPVTHAGVSKLNMLAAAPAAVVANEERAQSGSPHELATSLERSQSDSIMQCWQYGRLIMDERNWEARNLDSSGPQLYSSAGRHAKMRLMQFGDTFCALKYDARGR